MAVPVSQMWTVATYVLKQKIRGRKRYPLVLMLEPLFRCNLACAGYWILPQPAQARLHRKSGSSMSTSGYRLRPRMRCLRT